MTNEKIKKLMDEHLIGWYEPAQQALKSHYRITEENLILFIQKYILKGRK